MTRLLLLPALVCVLATSGCYTNPNTDRSQLLLLSEQAEIDLGLQSFAELKSDAKVHMLADAAWVAPLRRVGAAIAEAANKPEYQWEFELIDDAKTVNAFALPGGKIAFYTGIYPILQDEAGMAVVMGHEVSHALLRHGGERISQNMAAELVLAAAAISLENNEDRDVIMGALGVGAGLGVLLPYSRKHESEADEYGLLLAARAGYDPSAAIGVWERMAKLGGSRPPELLSTHPDPLNRIESMKRMMGKAQALYAQSQKKPNGKLPHR